MCQISLSEWAALTFAWFPAAPRHGRFICMRASSSDACLCSSPRVSTARVCCYFWVTDLIFPTLPWEAVVEVLVRFLRVAGEDDDDSRVRFSIAALGGGHRVALCWGAV